MMVVIQSSPFGGRTRTAVLLALRLLVESYPRELARTLDTDLSGVQQALRRLELDGLVAGRSVGRTRLYRINPSYFAFEDLQRFLLRLTEPEDQLRNRIELLRRRPRRTGKRL
jgi:DNA-binding transcriptional ArsR family regulator